MSKNKSIKIKRALISVSDKEGIVDFARKLYKLNIEIISTGGTENLLRVMVESPSNKELELLLSLLAMNILPFYPILIYSVLNQRSGRR